MIYLEVILAGAVFANMVAHWFAPFQYVKARLGEVGMWKVLNCSKCVGFWTGIPLGLVVFDDPVHLWTTPFILAFASYLVGTLIDFIRLKV